MKRRVDIEDLLRWAYRDELPKIRVDADISGIGPRLGSMWGAVGQAGETMSTMVRDGRLNSYGLLPSTNQFETPIHPDALVIGEAVNRLADVAFTLPEDWQPFADMDGLGGHAERLAAQARDRLVAVTEAGLRRVRFEPARLIVTYAVLGDRALWDSEPVSVGWVVHGNGKPRWFRRAQVPDGCGGFAEMEVDGFDQKRRRPFPDAYRKPRFDPDPAQIAEARAEYQVWCAAMAYLAADLAGSLADYEPAEPSRSWEPWLAGENKSRRILPSLVVGA